jgi:hypothetical protein
VHTHDMEEATAELRQSQHPPERILLDRGRLPRLLVAEDEDDLRGFIVGVLKESYVVDALAAKPPGPGAHGCDDA